MWDYELPPFFDEDVLDTLTLTVDLADTTDFASYQNGKIQIEDISSPDVPAGIFTIIVTLSDGIETVIKDIKVLIHEAP